VELTFHGFPFLGFAGSSWNFRNSGISGIA